jgi:hypothetical protein
VEAASSLEWIDIALVTGHQCVLFFGAPNHKARLEMGEELHWAADDLDRAST